MRIQSKSLCVVLGVVGLVLWLSGANLRARAGDDRRGLEGVWRITISSPPDCQGAPPACITASEFANFYPRGTWTETNTILFATSEPNPPTFSGASDGYGVWEKTDSPDVYSIHLEKFLFQTQTVPLAASPSGKLVVNTGIASIDGKYTVSWDGKTLSGDFTIAITPPDSNTVLFEAHGSVKGTRLER